MYPDFFKDLGEFPKLHELFNRQLSRHRRPLIESDLEKLYKRFAGYIKDEQRKRDIVQVVRDIIAQVVRDIAE
jgi:hypothetical protein